VSGTVNISVSDSSAARAVDEIYYQWAKPQLPPGSAITLPGRGTDPDGRILLIGVPLEVLPSLRERGISFIEVPAPPKAVAGDSIVCPVCGVTAGHFGRDVLRLGEHERWEHTIRNEDTWERVRASYRLFGILRTIML
jgi:hypothetical protein